MESAAAERKIAPTLVGFMIRSSTATRFAPRSASCTERGVGLSMAQSIPRVRENPVSADRTSEVAR